MSYRVETASTGRAGCKNKECKDAGKKIDKGELRLGTWVTFQEHGSWHWRHWGCVTGKQLENLRAYLVDPNKPGNYRWDFLDGYDEEGKNSLNHHPDLQEKVRRVISQGFIDSEDWNGDPEMNQLGKTGIRTAESKRNMKADAKFLEDKIVTLQEAVATAIAEREALIAQGLRPTEEVEAKINAAREELNKSHLKKEHDTKRVKPENDLEGEGPVKKKRKTKAKMDESDDDDVKPVKKSRGKKAVKDEDSDEEVIPAKKSRGKKTVKKEEDVDEEDSEAEVVPAKKARGKKVAKKEDDIDIIKDEENFDAPANLPAPKKRAARGKQAKEEGNGLEDEVKSKALVKKPRGKKGAKQEPVKENSLEGESQSPEAKKAQVKKSRVKKAIKPEVSSDTALPDAQNTSGSSMKSIKKRPDNLAVPAETSSDLTDINEEASEVEVGGEDVAMSDTPEAASTKLAPKPLIKKLTKGKKVAAARAKSRQSLTRGQTES